MQRFVIFGMGLALGLLLGFSAGLWTMDRPPVVPVVQQDVEPSHWGPRQ